MSQTRSVLCDCRNRNLGFWETLAYLSRPVSASQGEMQFALCRREQANPEIIPPQPNRARVIATVGGNFPTENWLSQRCRIVAVAELCNQRNGCFGAHEMTRSRLDAEQPQRLLCKPEHKLTRTLATGNFGIDHHVAELAMSRRELQSIAGAWWTQPQREARRGQSQTDFRRRTTWHIMWTCRSNP